MSSFTNLSVQPTTCPPPPPASANSVDIHGGDGGGGDLIQDATHVRGNIHEALLVHQDEGVFLWREGPDELSHHI